MKYYFDKGYKTYSEWEEKEPKQISKRELSEKIKESYGLIILLDIKEDKMIFGEYDTCY